MKFTLAGLAAVLALIFILPDYTEAQDASLLASGGFDNQEYQIRGDWRIEARADGNYIVLSDDFRTRRGPDLKIFFSTNAAVDVNGENGDEGFFLTALDSNRGGQAYRLPDDFALEDYSSVVIQCEQFSKLWGAGTINLATGSELMDASMR
ncbi:MAG: DM13 domain-containing protein [Alphaproteobacteria bacterium]|nr:DM13 domain-containing protein [Alphaproteobacteria bacterium]